MFHCFSLSWLKGSSPLPLFCVLSVLKYPPFFSKSSPHSSNKNYPGIFFDFKRLLNIVWHTSMRISCDKYNKRRMSTHYVIRRFTIVIYLWTIFLGLDLSNFSISLTDRDQWKERKKEQIPFLFTSYIGMQCEYKWSDQYSLLLEPIDGSFI